MLHRNSIPIKIISLANTLLFRYIYLQRECIEEGSPPTWMEGPSGLTKGWRAYPCGGKMATKREDVYYIFKKGVFNMLWDKSIRNQQIFLSEKHQLFMWWVTSDYSVNHVILLVNIKFFKKSTRQILQLLKVAIMVHNVIFYYVDKVIPNRRLRSEKILMEISSTT